MIKLERKPLGEEILGAGDLKMNTPYYRYVNNHVNSDYIYLKTEEGLVSIAERFFSYSPLENFENYQFKECTDQISIHLNFDEGLAGKPYFY